MGSHLSRSRDSDRDRAAVDEFSEADIRRKFMSMPTLTEPEKEVIKTSWRAISYRSDEIGTTSFLELFSAYPDTEVVFSQFVGVAPEALADSDEILAQGRVFMAAMASFVQAIDDRQAVWDTLIPLGRRHFHYGAPPMYLELMSAHFVIAVRQTVGSDWYEALEYHWLAAFRIIDYVMNFGWNLERADQQKKARLLESKPNQKGAETTKKR